MELVENFAYHLVSTGMKLSPFIQFGQLDLVLNQVVKHLSKNFHIQFFVYDFS